MDQNNYPIFQYKLEDISDDILECNSISIIPFESIFFSYYLEHVTTISNLENSNVSVYASDPVFVTFTKSSLSYNLECFTLSSSIECSDPLLYTSEYFILLHYSNQSISSLNNLENFTSLSDNLNDSNFSNTITLQNTRKHKSVFVASSTKKPKPKKSWGSLRPLSEISE
ncbi:hypothetical protein F8M41_017688 [Gigaspora margarita]|uniref:Uncharacterized protein n=1 Tax=Gigaspora margarita TaxID=4874 RepID=A0A8H4AMN5_GIGMA|nr:hypothetical protein F8M41_017688 [Gigaspora margarita]